MQIKEAAAKCGLTEKAIRLYEEKGLITPTYTEINGRKFRDYDEKTVEQLKTIAGLRQSFFSIEQIAAMQNTPEDIPTIFSEYRDELRGKFRELEGLLERADAVIPSSLSSAEALAEALGGVLSAPNEPAQIADLSAALPEDEPYRIRRVETHAVPEMRFRVWDEDVDRDAREAAYERYLRYVKEWERSYDTELNIDKVKHFWLYPIGKFVVLPLLCLAVIGCFLYFVGWRSKVDITYTGYEITFSEDVWDEIGTKLSALPDGAKPHEMDVSEFPQAVESKDIDFRFDGWKTDYLFKKDTFEGLMISDGFGGFDAGNRRKLLGDMMYQMTLPGQIMQNGFYTTPIRAADRAMLLFCEYAADFGDDDGILIFPLMESNGFDANGEGHSSGNTYIILGAKSPEEASQLFWDKIWRQWQEDIYEVNPDYFRETAATTE